MVTLPELRRKSYRESRPGLHWDEQWGDREVKVVFIGAGMDWSGTVDDLENRIVSETEMDGDSDTFENPFPGPMEWSVPPLEQRLVVDDQRQPEQSAVTTALSTRIMTDIDADELLPAEPIRDSVLAGDVTQLHRGDKHATEGDIFEIDGTTFEVTAVREQRLGDLTDEDARAEGSPDLDAYKQRIEQTHDVTWNDENTAVLHRFEPVE